MKAYLLSIYDSSADYTLYIKIYSEKHYEIGLEHKNYIQKIFPKGYSVWLDEVELYGTEEID